MKKMTIETVHQMCSAKVLCPFHSTLPRRF